jgi:crotonobetainyl-CoA:carnitine CoA-transferase CaiB-like acyl-CoA transferase
VEACSGSRQSPPAFREQTRLINGTIRFAIVAAVTATLVLAGGFGSWREPLAERLAFWAVGPAIGAAISLAVAGRLRLAPFLGRRPVAAAFLAAGLTAGPLALAAAIAVAVLHRRPLDWGELGMTAPQVLFVSLFLTAAGRLAPQIAPPTPAPPDRFLRALLPHSMRSAAIVALEAQDHYVRVHTQDGAALVRCRLEQAAAACSEINGRRVHRSWWVARDAVATIARGDGRALLTLANGLSVPVSRRYAKELRKARWR